MESAVGVCWLVMNENDHSTVDIRAERASNEGGRRKKKRRKQQICDNANGTDYYNINYLCVCET